jgi:hypothetical protein
MDHPFCSWTGLAEDGETMEPCGRPATHYFLSADGHRTYTCLAHLAHAKAEAEVGAIEHAVPDPALGAPRDVPRMVD